MGQKKYNGLELDERTGGARRSLRGGNDSVACEARKPTSNLKYFSHLKFISKGLGPRLCVHPQDLGLNFEVNHTLTEGPPLVELNLSVQCSRNDSR